MADSEFGISIDMPIMFVFPLPDGRWRSVDGSMSVVDGHHHKIAFPGFETRSGEGFGITATYHLISPPLTTVHGKLLGNILQMTILNGRVGEMKPMAQGVEIVRDSPLPASS